MQVRGRKVPSSAYIIKFKEYTGSYWVYSFTQAHVALVVFKKKIRRAFDNPQEKLSSVDSYFGIYSISIEWENDVFIYLFKHIKGSFMTFIYLFIYI